MKVKKIRKLGKPNKDLFNLHVEKNHNYIANNLVISNCHDVRGTQLNNVIQKLDNIRYRYGFTGTLPSNIIEQKKIIGALGDKKHIIDTKKLIKQGHATPVEVTFINFSYERYFVPSYNRWSEENKYIREHENRIIFISKLAKNKIDKNENSILFVNDIKYKSNVIFKDHILSQGIDDKKVILLTKGMKDKDFIELKKKLEKESGYIIITTYQLASIGISIKNIHNLIFAQPVGKNNIKVLQTIGRGIRKHHSKKIVNIYDIVDLLNYSIKHKSIREQYYKEHDFDIKEINIKL